MPPPIPSLVGSQGEIIASAASLDILTYLEMAVACSYRTGSQTRLAGADRGTFPVDKACNCGTRWL